MGLFDNIRFPYFNQQQLNLDWILTAVKNALSLLPSDDGAVGQVLKKTADGTEWEDIGALAVDIHSLPQDTEISATDETIFYDRSAGANRKMQYTDFISNSASNASPRMAGTAAAGTSKLYSRGDHVHPTDTSRAPANYFSDGKLQIAHGGTGSSNAAAAVAALGAVDLNAATALDGTANLNTLTQTGTYNVGNAATAATITGTPTTAAGYKLIVAYVGSDRRVQIAITSEEVPRMLMRWYNTSTSTWGEWLKMHSTADFRCEVSSAISAGSTFTIDLYPNSKGVLFTTGSNVRTHSGSIINVTSAANVSLSTFYAATNTYITFDTSTLGKLTIQNAAGGGTAFAFGLFFVTP